MKEKKDIRKFLKVKYTKVGLLDENPTPLVFFSRLIVKLLNFHLELRNTYFPNLMDFLMHIITIENP